MDLTVGLLIVAGLFLLILVPYLVLEGAGARRTATRGSRGSSHAATAISDLMWAFATRSPVWTRRGGCGADGRSAKRACRAVHVVRRRGYRKGSDPSLLAFSTSASIHFWNSSALWTVTNPRIR